MTQIQNFMNWNNPGVALITGASSGLELHMHDPFQHKNLNQFLLLGEGKDWKL